MFAAYQDQDDSELLDQTGGQAEGDCLQPGVGPVEDPAPMSLGATTQDRMAMGSAAAAQVARTYRTDHWGSCGFVS